MNDTQRKKLQQQTEIEIRDKIKYLGIIFSNRISTLYQDNHEKLLKDIQGD